METTNSSPVSATPNALSPRILTRKLMTCASQTTWTHPTGDRYLGLAAWNSKRELPAWNLLVPKQAKFFSLLQADLSDQQGHNISGTAGGRS
jgi:hypothetical protein